MIDKTKYKRALDFAYKFFKINIRIKENFMIV